MPGIQSRDGLWYVGGRLLIPHTGNLHETLFCLVHDVLGHFGFNKTYASLRKSYFWPNMHCDLEAAYVPGCAECQRNKSSTTKPTGPLHLLPVPNQRGDSVGSCPNLTDHTQLLTLMKKILQLPLTYPTRLTFSQHSTHRLLYLTLKMT